MKWTMDAYVGRGLSIDAVTHLDQLFSPKMSAAHFASNLPCNNQITLDQLDATQKSVYSDPIGRDVQFFTRVKFLNRFIDCKPHSRS